MKYAIVTGASKGLGEGIARKLLEEQVKVIAVSRSDNEELHEVARKIDGDYHYFRCNLASTEETLAVFQRISETIFQQTTEAVYLINNAGIVDPIETVGDLNDTAILDNVQINLTAPVLISNLIIKQAEKTQIPLTIANVTSGAAERPVHGWSIYCSTKAAINMFTRTTGLELENKASSTKMIAYSPGIMDTDMQTTIRSSTEKAFYDVDKFKEYKEKGMLRSPAIVANALVKLMFEGNLENGKVYYVNDLL
ncbi:benzil reductase ((S)-benzoin forming) [Mesobacillus persicus]|uniref:Benzil reductase ((S)-benzoin forming) n=1 Tax=Mesobacillus persicus TaxID=930146 RepID=A0A1H7ZXK1_9BACI|nr:(S)-benzoin forming benzil reductase [Mesobacillus persicus]SEM63195.1 benzil reductase ((S)-benzoin forming) [Mesobacillus persicus]